MNTNALTKSLAKNLAAFGLALMAMVFATLAIAQPVDPTAPYRDFRPANDLATWVMKGLLGATYENPFGLGGATTLFGQIFIVFNMIVFSVGLVWGSYGVVSSVVQTAHEGVVLGKRINPIWFPIRMATGIGGLVPVFGGFSLAQVFMIVATSTGIAFGNYGFNLFPAVDLC
jgi:conjugal transfer/type IV secretion protein DotA/TraY